MMIIIIIIIIISVKLGCRRRYIIFLFAAGSRQYLEAVQFRITILIGVVYAG